jgi:predicted amidohydrolase YtcJ
MATTDRDLAEALWADRLEGAYAYASLRRSGARLAGGSDAPVEALSPLDGMRAAVLRTADDRPPWRPQEALPREAALLAYTRTPAWLSGEEHVRGRLSPGLAADLVVLDRDPLADDEALRECSVVATMLAGRWVHGAP